MPPVPFRPARRRARCLLVVPVFACCHAAPTPSHGPLPVRNQHPAQLTVMQLDPASPAVLAGGDTSVRATSAYTSLWLGGTNGLSTFAMDGEIWRNSLQLQTGLGGGLQVGFELPVLHTTGGFLDDFLVDYHDFFGFPDQGRSTGPENRFRVFGEQNGNVVYELREESLLWCDVPVTMTWCVLPPGRTADGSGLPGLAVRAGVEAPTGDEEAGAGNGEFDWAVGASASWPFAFGTVFANAQHTWAGTPDRARAAAFGFGDVASAMVGLDLPVLGDFSVLAQTSWEQSTLRALDLPRASDDQILLWVGGRLRLESRWFVEIAFGEDLSEYIAPDFTAFLSMAYLPYQGSAWRGPRS